MELKKTFFKNCNKKAVIKLKDTVESFSDKRHIKKLQRKNPLIYIVLVKNYKDLNYALTIIEPGIISKEFFMTRGHYHKIPSPEMYYLLSGKGFKEKILER